MRRHRLALASGTAALALAGGGALLVSLFNSAAPNTPANGSSPVGAAGSPVTAAASPGASASAGVAAPPTTALPVPGTRGDGYARNVVAGGPCSPAGALGFTPDGKPVRCTTTATDAQLRWRAR